MLLLARGYELPPFLRLYRLWRIGLVSDWRYFCLRSGICLAGVRQLSLRARSERLVSALGGGRRNDLRDISRYRGDGVFSLTGHAHSYRARHKKEERRAEPFVKAGFAALPWRKNQSVASFATPSRAPGSSKR